MNDEPKTAKEMKTELFRHFFPRYAVVTEVSHVDVNAKYPAPSNRICDVLLWKQDDRIAVEVKVSKADLLSDVSDPTKQALWASVTHRLAFAVPLSLLDLALEKVPVEYGVLAVGPQPGYARVTWARRAAKVKGRVPENMHPFTTGALIMRCADAESKLKGHGFRDSLPDDAESLRAEVKRLTHELALEKSAKDRYQAKTKRLTQALGKVKPMACAYCKTDIKPARTGFGWQHVATGQDDKCRDIRRAQGQSYVYSTPEPAEEGE